MMIFNNGRQAQGEALPAAVRRGTIHPAGGLDTHRQGWRIRHPQAATYKGQSATLPPFLATCRGSIHIWGHGSGAKEKVHRVFPGKAALIFRKKYSESRNP